MSGAGGRPASTARWSRSRGRRRLAMLDLVRVGPQRLPGEVIALAARARPCRCTSTRAGSSPARRSSAPAAPLAVELGPGLLGGVFDGMLRPLRSAGPRIEPGGAARDARRATRAGASSPSVAGRRAADGGRRARERAARRAAIEHRVLVPPGAEGALEWIAPAGDYRVTEVVARVGGARAGARRSAGRCAVRDRCARGCRRPSRSSPASGCSTCCSRSRGARTRGDPRRLRHRQDRAAAADREVVRRRRDRVRGLRRARQRAGRRARRSSRRSRIRAPGGRCSTARC